MSTQPQNNLQSPGYYSTERPDRLFPIQQPDCQSSPQAGRPVSDSRLYHLLLQREVANIQTTFQNEDDFVAVPRYPPPPCRGASAGSTTLIGDTGIAPLRTFAAKAGFVNSSGEHVR